MKITRDFVDTLRDEIDEALKGIGEKYGLAVAAGNATFTESNVTFKLSISDPIENWKRCVANTGLLPEDYGKIVIFGKLKLQIVGFDSNARTNKVQLIDPATGKHYHANVHQTVSALNAMDPARAGSKNATPEQIAETEEQKFDTKAFICGLKGRVTYGQTFTWNGDTYRITDLNTKAPKYPIVAENVKTGAKYRFGKDVLPAKEGAV